MKFFRYLLLACISLGFCVSLKAQSKFLLQTDKEFYYSGETIRLDIWTLNAVSMLPNTFAESITIDFVEPTGKVIQTKKLFTSPYSLQIKVPEVLKTGYFRLVCNAKNETPSVLTFPIYSLQDAEKSTSVTSALPVRLFAKAQSGRLVKRGNDTILLRALDKDSIGVSVLISAFNENDSLLSFIQTDQNGVGFIKQNNQTNVYKFVLSDLKDSLVTQDSIPVHFKTKTSKDSVFIQLTNSNFVIKNFNFEQTYTFSFLQFDKVVLSFPLKMEDLGKIKSISLSKLSLPNGILSLRLDSLGTSIQEQQLAIFKESILNENPVSQLKSKIKINSNVKTPFLAIKMLDSKKVLYETTSLQSKLISQTGNDLLFPLSLPNKEDLNRYIALNLFDLNTKAAYKKTLIPFQFDCTSYKDLFLTFLLPETWKGIQIPCDSIIYYESILKKHIHSESPFLAYAFSEHRKHVSQLQIQKATPYRYHPLKISINLSEAQIAALQEQKKIKQIASIYDASTPVAQSKLHFDVVYRMKEYNFPSTMKQTLIQMIPELKVSSNLKGKVTQLKIYPYMTRYPYPDSPLILINNIPTYEIDDLFTIDPNNVDSIAVINTYLSFKQLDYFGRNGVLAVFLKLGIDNPLENGTHSLPKIAIEPVADYEIPKSKVDLRPIIYWNAQFSNQADKSFKFKLPSYSSTFTIQIQGISKEGYLINQMLELPSN